MRKPNLGDVVIYMGQASNDRVEHAAVVTRVWSDVCVNLTFFPDGTTDLEQRSSVTYYDDAPPKLNTWHWGGPVGVGN